MSYSDHFKESNNSATLEEKINIIKHNINQAANMRKEINAWGGVYYK